MSEAIHEQISALLDGELSERETAAALERLREQEGLREAWGRYHLIGDALRGEYPAGSGPSIAERVRERIEQEPAILAPGRGRGEIPWMHPLVGVALAASVAVVAIFSAPYLFNGGPAVTPQLTADSSQPAASQYGQLAQPAAYRVLPIPTPPRREVASSDPGSGQYAERAGTRWKNLAQPTVESRLNRYLVNHGEYATRAAVQGVSPYVTFAGYDAQR